MSNPFWFLSGPWRTIIWKRIAEEKAEAKEKDRADTYLSACCAAAMGDRKPLDDYWAAHHARQEG